MAQAKEIKTRKGFCYYIAADSDPENRMYIGSSITIPRQRKASHKYAKQDTTAAPILQFADWDLHVIESYDLEGTKEEAIAELRQYEQSWIEILRQDCVNKTNANGLDEEKRRAYVKMFSASEKGKAAQKKGSAKHYKANRVRILAKAKEKYREKTNKEAASLA